MKKVLIRLQGHSLFFSYKRNQVVRDDLMNTNIISDSELIFSDDYILENESIVMPFFKELCEMNHINSLVFQNNEIACFLLKYFKGIKSIAAIRIKKEENVSYELCELLISLKSIHLLDCFSIPNFMMELLDKHQIKVITHSEVFYISPFMLKNQLTNYSKLFYKQEIDIYSKLSLEDKEDLSTFFRINRYLQVINFHEYNKDDIEYILESLKTHQYRNVYLILYQDITDVKEITYLKELNKKYRRKGYQLQLNYSKEYISDNLLKQIYLNTLKFCGLILISIVVGSFGYVFVRNYISMQEVSSIQEVVNDTISKADDLPLEDVKPSSGSKTEIKNKYIASLLTINPDVVGYLKVNNTNVDYPVVISKDNVYYLGRNLYQEEDINGWVYMDFRNSIASLNDNTIIYGHNMYYSGVMFGTLHKTLSDSWQSDPNNLVITFDTLYESMQWQIFSIYTIQKTSDYLRVSFDDAQDKINYISMVKNRSTKDFGVDVTSDDKILTLSTCTGDNARLVIHAKKIVNTEASN